VTEAFAVRSEAGDDGGEGAVAGVDVGSGGSAVVSVGSGASVAAGVDVGVDGTGLGIGVSASEVRPDPAGPSEVGEAGANVGTRPAGVGASSPTRMQADDNRPRAKRTAARLMEGRTVLTRRRNPKCGVRTTDRRSAGTVGAPGEPDDRPYGGFVDGEA
jgi:hypothetical protein